VTKIGALARLPLAVLAGGRNLRKALWSHYTRRKRRIAMNGKGTLFLALVLLLLALAGCGAEPSTGYVTVVVTSEPSSGVVTVVVTPEPPSGQVIVVATETPPAPETGIEVLEATFAHGLSEQMEPVDPGASFAPDETVYLSVKVRGRPKAGQVTAHFYWGDVSIAEASVDLADANSGLLFSIGENTYAGYTLTHTDPLPLSDNYRADLFYDGVPLGSTPFRVVPSGEAIPSQVTQVVLAQGADENYNPVEPATEFSFDQTVYLVGRGDLGLDTWLQAEWYVGGRLDDAGTRSLTAEENLQGAAFSFSFLPEGGWPPGEHFVVLTMNDREVGRYTFTVVASGE